MRDTAPAVGDQAGRLLDASAGGTDDADVTPRYGVGKRQRHAANNGSAAVGTHDKQPTVARLALQGDFLRERHVVGENHYVQSALQPFAGFGGGKAARNRD